MRVAGQEVGYDDDSGIRQEANYKAPRAAQNKEAHRAYDLLRREHIFLVALREVSTDSPEFKRYVKDLEGTYFGVSKPGDDEPAKDAQIPVLHILSKSEVCEAARSALTGTQKDPPLMMCVAMASPNGPLKNVNASLTIDVAASGFVVTKREIFKPGSVQATIKVGDDDKTFEVNIGDYLPESIANSNKLKKVYGFKSLDDTMRFIEEQISAHDID